MDVYEIGRTVELKLPVGMTMSRTAEGTITRLTKTQIIVTITGDDTLEGRERRFQRLPYYSGATIDFHHEIGYLSRRNSAVLNIRVV